MLAVNKQTNKITTATSKIVIWAQHCGAGMFFAWYFLTWNVHVHESRTKIHSSHANLIGTL